jgi:two-component system, chemotaxis family, protein-glutamate methylesterase/glutaminase
MAYGVVVIGSSLGGLQAVATVLAALPEGFHLPIVIAQHRATVPPSDGELPAIWQRHTSLVVCDAGDKAPILPGRIYVAPADYHLMIETRDRLALSTEGPVLWARPSIDVLFDTAAEAYRGGVIGMILTGASADGSQGLRAIRARGGCALVQEPTSAECDVMPRAALAATSVNHVLGLADLGRLLGTLAGQLAEVR